MIMTKLRDIYGTNNVGSWARKIRAYCRSVKNRYETTSAFGRTQMKSIMLAGYIILLHVFLIYNINFNVAMKSDNLSEMANESLQNRSSPTFSSLPVKSGIEEFPEWAIPLKTVISPRADICRNISYLLVVRCRPEDFDKRLMYRNTYGRFATKFNFTLMFSVGLSVDVNFNTTQLKQESQRFQDILQSNFMDVFKNISYKTGAILDFYVKNCDPSVALLKQDDDVRWKVASMSNMIERLKHLPTGIACQILVGHEPNYDLSYKWSVTREEYNGTIYPNCCQGASFVLTYRVSVKIMKELPYSRFFWLDDVYYTGILREKVNETLVAFEEVMDDVPSHLTDEKLIDVFKKDYPNIE